MRMPFLKKKQTEYEEPAKSFPPFVAATAALESRLRTQRRFSVGVVAFAFGVVALEEYRIGQMAEQLARSEYLVIPGAVDFMSVRPGIPPDAAVFAFADWSIEQLGNFNYLNVDERYKRLAEFMTAECRERFFLELRSKVPRYKEFAVTEIFRFQPIKEFKLERKDGRAFYVVSTVGEVDRYSGDQKLRGTSHREVITVRFRTSPIKASKPWIFEIESIERMSEAERDRLALAARSGEKKK